MRSLLPLLLISLLAAQESRPAADEVLVDGKKIDVPRVQLDPTGALDVSGKDGEGKPWGLRLQFAPFRLPAPGTYVLGEKVDERTLVWSVPKQEHVDDLGKPVAVKGEVAVESFDARSVRVTLSYSTPPDPVQHSIRIAAVPRLGPQQPATVADPRELPAFLGAAAAPSREDLVFCALGSQGTGLPGQRRVADAIAKLAPTGPLDFVLLCGDNFMPNGVRSLDDPLWQSRFEQVYRQKNLDVPFYAALGEADYRGDIKMQIDYGSINRRWTMLNNVYSFKHESHGKTLEFFAADTCAMIGDIGNAHNRIANRLIVHALQYSKADWKIVFGYYPMFSSGATSDSATTKTTRERLEYFFEQFKADVYIAGGERSLELLEPVKGTTHVISGGGGGPEVAQSTRQGKSTVFAATGGGFTWFRFDGKTLEISFRDSDGNTLFVHHVQK